MSDSEKNPDEAAGASPSAEAGTDEQARAQAAEARRARLEQLRVRRRPHEGEPIPIDVFRMRAQPGQDALELVQGDGGDPPLVFPEGPEGEAERRLGCADTNGALAAIEGIAPGSDDELIALTVRVRAHLMEGGLDEARALLGTRRSEDALALADAALALAEGEIAHAARRVEGALARRPNGIGEHYLQALVRVAEGRMQEALELLSLVAKSAPEHAVARYQLGQLLLAAGDPARAGTLFEMAWALQPSFIAPAMALAEMLADSRQLGEALLLLGNVCDQAPNALSPRLLQLRVLLELGEKDAAVSLAAALREKLPGEPEVALLWAEALLESERYDEAKAALLAIVDRTTPAHEQKARRILARVALAERPPQIDEALEQLKRAAGLLPGTGDLHVEIVHVAMAAGRRRDAETALDSLAQEDHVDVGALLSGAILARSHGLWSHAARLGNAAKDRVAGTPAEAQLEAFLATLPSS